VRGSYPAWGVALAVGALGLAALGLGLGVGGRPDGAAMAQAAEARPAAEGAAGAVVSTARLSDSEVVICIMDTVRQRLVVYVADTKRSRLRLLAVRDVSADWALTDYNNDPPLPKDVRARVEGGSGTGGAAAGAGEGKKGEQAP